MSPSPSPSPDAVEQLEARVRALVEENRRLRARVAQQDATIAALL